MKKDSLPQDRLGHRFSIRLHDPCGGYRDVVGHLISANSLINRHGSEVVFDPNQIAFWREIIDRPDLAGKGAPLTLRVMELDQICNATWPALENLEVGGWLLRAANGITNRANSVLPLQSALEDGSLKNFSENLIVAKKFYQDRNLPLIFHLALPTWDLLQSKLISLGAKELIRAHTMVADLIKSELDIPVGYELIQTQNPNFEWLALNQTPCIEDILNGCPATYLSLAHGGKNIATARIAIFKSWASITRVYVDNDFRGKGLGKLIVTAALNASYQEGATKAVLQVEAKNQVAIGIYESLGFNFHHEYIYLETN